jgi:hypothetical protein
MIRIFISISLFSLALSLSAQDKTLPYYEIPNYPESFTAGAVASRMIDGAGFRYYWATEGLRPEDLAFKPNADARTSEETITHIYELSTIVINSLTRTVNAPASQKLSFVEMRKQTLKNLKMASDRLRVCADQEMKDFKIIFKSKNGTTVEYPFWNELNGPIADCLWHIGQVVSFRRSSGNPFTEKANVFSGKVTQ